MRKNRSTQYAAIPLAVILLGGCASGAAESDHLLGSEPSTAALSDSERIDSAERLVRDALPDVPMWEGSAIEGFTVDEFEVCVDRTWAPSGGPGGVGGSAGYVIVTFPDLSISDPVDGECDDYVIAVALQNMDAPDEIAGRPGLVTSNDFGDEWPLTIPYAIVKCRVETASGQSIQIATLDDTRGTEYALNGAAKGTDAFADIETIWADSTSVDGLKADMSVLIDVALEQCE